MSNDLPATFSQQVFLSVKNTAVAETLEPLGAKGWTSETPGLNERSKGRGAR